MVNRAQWQKGPGIGGRPWVGVVGVVLFRKLQLSWDRHDGKPSAFGERGCGHWAQVPRFWDFGVIISWVHWQQSRKLEVQNWVNIMCGLWQEGEGYTWEQLDRPWQADCAVGYWNVQSHFLCIYDQQRHSLHCLSLSKENRPWLIRRNFLKGKISQVPVVQWAGGGNWVLPNTHHASPAIKVTTTGA